MIWKLQKPLVFCVLGVCAFSLSVLIAQETTGDPTAVERVRISREDLQKEFARGAAFATMPLADFDETLTRIREAAAQKLKDNKNAPRLMRSVYKAQLVDGSLVGSGSWSVHDPGDGQGPALLPLSAMNLALSKAQNATHKTPAIFAEDGKNLGLVLLQPGSQTIAFDWSARGVDSPGGLRFELRLPPCPLGSLELELPKDFVVSVPRSAALSAEAKSKDPSKSIWLLSLTGKSQVDLDIRRLASPATDGTEARLVQVASVQEIRADRVKADFEFQIEVPHHPVRKLIFDFDPALKPYEVVLAEQKNAEILKWGVAENKSSLAVEFREPFHGSLPALQVRCLAARQPDQPWTSPFMRLRGALTRGEKLKLLVHDGVTLPKWDAGGFMLLGSERAADGSLVLSLQDPRTIDTRGGQPPQRRPSVGGKTPGIDLHTRQQTFWHVSPQGMALDADITFEMARGSLYQLQVRLPKFGKSWRIERLAVSPPDMLLSYSRTDQLLTIDLSQPVTPRRKAELKVELRSPWDHKTLLEFPDLEPFHAAIREGGYHIDVDPSFQASVTEHSVPAVSESELAELPSRPAPLFSFRFRDQVVNPQPFMPPALAGKLRILPSSDRLQAVTRTRAVLAADHASVQTRLELEPLMGSLEQCDLLAGKAAWQARFEKASGRSLRLEPRPLEDRLPYLLGLGNPSPLTWLPLLAATENLQIYRLRFSPPLTQRETILLEAPCTARGDHWWDVPLLTVLDTPRRQGELLLQPSGTVLGQVLAQGLELPARDQAASLDLRRLPLDPAQMPALRVQASPAASVLTRQEHIDRARLQSYVLEDGRAFHHFSFQVANWPGRDIAMVLPADAKVVGARVAGLWQDDVPLQPAADGVEVRLPVPNGLALPLSFTAKGDFRSLRDSSGPWQIDVFYSSEASGTSWSVATHYQSAWPKLPVAPLTRQRTWYLAPGLAPLRQDLWRDALVPAGPGAAGRDLVRQAWQAGEPLLDAFAPRPGDDNRHLRDAELDVRKKWASLVAAGNFTLGTAVEHLMADRALIVVDAAGLRAAGISPETPLARLPAPTDQPFWESLGLTTVASPSGNVLTTRRQAQDWRGALSPADLDAAVAQAVVYGRDRHGVLQLATTWLASGDDSIDAALHEGAEATSAVRTPGLPIALPHGLFFGQPPTGWTVWEPSSHLDDEPAFDVVRTDELRHLAYVFGLAALVLSWRTRRALSGVVFFRVLLVWTVVWGLAYIWLPTSLQIAALGPLVASWAFALLAYLITLARGVPGAMRRSQSTRTMLKGSSLTPAALLLVLLGCLPLVSAQNAPASKTELPRVFIVPGDAPKKEIACVPVKLWRELLDKAKEAAFSPLPSPALLVAADYKGEVTENLVEFEATFDIFCASESARLSLPLAGVDLMGEARLKYLDGGGKAQEVPTLLGSPENRKGYVVNLTGKGMHRLTLSCRAGWKNKGDFQELSFDIPRLAQSRLRLRLPSSWHDVQLPYCQGMERIHAADDGFQEMEAQLGRESMIQVRFSTEVNPAPPAFDVRELYLWDLRPAHFAVTGLLQYNVTRGAVSQLRILLPDNVDIQSVELGGLAAGGTRILKWGVEEKRQLRIDLASPVTGKLPVVLNMVPRLALDAPLQLRLPVPLGAVKLLEGKLAYRLEGWESTDVSGVKSEDFVREWKEAGQRDPGPITRAWNFRREPGQQAFVQPRLQPIRPALRQEVFCQVHPVFTDVTVRVHAQGSAEAPITLVRCEVPAAMVLAGVTGKDIHHWTRSDSVVQIWLMSDRPSAPVTEANITLSGWIKNAQPQEGEKTGRFLLPRIRVLPDQGVPDAARVEAGPGCLVEPASYGPLWNAALALAYDSTFLVRPAPPSPEVRTLTTAGVNNGIFSFSTRVDCKMLREVPLQKTRQNYQVELTLRDWPADVQLDPLPPEFKKPDHRRTGNDHTWIITLPPKQLWPLSLQVHGKRELKPSETIAVPVIEVARATYRGRWLVWSGPDPKPRAPGWLPLKDLAGIRRYWPAEFHRLAADSLAWQMKDAKGQFEIEAPATTAPRAWKVLWAEHDIHHQDSRWLHEASWFLTMRAAAELNLELPEGASFQAACWGDAFINPRLDDARRLTLQLPQDLSGQILRLRFKYDGKEEALLQPHVDVPVFPGSAEVPLSATLWLPLDFAVPAHASTGTEVLLQRARGQMQLCRLLAENAAEEKGAGTDHKGIRAAQLCFQVLTRHAEYELIVARGRLDPAPERSRAQLGELDELRKQNREWAAAYRYTKARQEAERLSTPHDFPRAALSLPQSGLPIHDFRAAQEPLIKTGKMGLSFAVFSTQLLVVGFVALFFLSFLPRLFWALPALWPEQLLAVGVLGTLLAGLSLLGILLIAAGLLGRTLWLTRWCWRMTGRLFRRSAAAAPP